MNPIQTNVPRALQLPAVPTPPAAPPIPGLTGRPEASFKNLLLEGIDQVNSMQQQADRAVEQLLTGEDVDPAVVLTSIQKADMSFRMMMQIRNKLMQAYQELKEMRI
jgi:flagellar hook-basal body complex protein FliE